MPKRVCDPATGEYRAAPLTAGTDQLRSSTSTGSASQEPTTVKTAPNARNPWTYRTVLGTPLRSPSTLPRVYPRALYPLTGICPKRYIWSDMDATLTALAEPNRKRIVEFLREGPQPVGAIVLELKLRQPQVSKHLRVLSDAGWVEVHPVAQQRIYSLRAQAFQELYSWANSYSRLWEEQMDRFDTVLQEMQRKENRHARN
jgi:DNA-binding transcriptional ArsR family regulator